MSLQKVSAGLVAALMLCSCAPDFDPPPDYKGGFLADSDKSRTVIVQVGDSLYSISRRYDVPTKIIADRNGLKAPYELTTGQTLILDPTRVHVVAEGDTLQAVAQKYGVDQSALIAANELTPPYRLRAGVELWIPDPITNAALPQVASVDLRANGGGDVDAVVVQTFAGGAELGDDLARHRPGETHAGTRRRFVQRGARRHDLRRQRGRRSDSRRHRSGGQRGARRGRRWNCILRNRRRYDRGRGRRRHWGRERRFLRSC